MKRTRGLFENSCKNTACRVEVKQNLVVRLWKMPSGRPGSYGRVFDVIVLGRPGRVKESANDHTRSCFV
jgi:hypothetical protein